MKVSISKAAKELGVHQETLRRWEMAGKIKPERTVRGHRRYDLAKLRGLIPQTTIENRLTLEKGKGVRPDNWKKRGQA